MCPARDGSGGWSQAGEEHLRFSTGVPVAVVYQRGAATFQCGHLRDVRIPRWAGATTKQDERDQQWRGMDAAHAVDR